MLLGYVAYWCMYADDTVTYFILWHLGGPSKNTFEW
jgi:hypothetical protein